MPSHNPNTHAVEKAGNKIVVSKHPDAVVREAREDRLLVATKTKPKTTEERIDRIEKFLAATHGTDLFD